MLLTIWTTITSSILVVVHIVCFFFLIPPLPCWFSLLTSLISNFKLDNGSKGTPTSLNERSPSQLIRNSPTFPEDSHDSVPKPRVPRSPLTSGSLLVGLCGLWYPSLELQTVSKTLLRSYKGLWGRVFRTFVRFLDPSHSEGFPWYCIWFPWYMVF